MSSKTKRNRRRKMRRWLRALWAPHETTWQEYVSSSYGLSL